MKGWIKLHRDILKWEWYSSPNMFHLFTHCLLMANLEDKRWQGLIIERGSFITSVKKLSLETGISAMSIRTCLKKLEITDEIVKKSTNKTTLITICKYSSYNEHPRINNKQLTNQQQTSNKQLTTTKEYKEYKELKEKEIKKINFFNKENFEISENQNLEYPREIPEVISINAKTSDLSALKNLCLTNSQTWCETLAIQLKMPLNSISGLLDEFNNHLIGIGDNFKSPKDYRTHCYNWAVKRAKFPSNTTTNTNQQKTNNYGRYEEKRREYEKI